MQPSFGLLGHPVKPGDDELFVERSQNFVFARLDRAIQ